MRRNVRGWIAVVFVGTVASSLVAQTPAELRFDAVSIKRNTSGSSGSSVGDRGDGWRMTNATTLAILYSAYAVPNREVANLPDWVSRDRYDVVTSATMRPSRGDEQVMLRAMLADRFKLKAHVEPREISVYALVPARADRPLPAALQRIATDCAALDAAVRRGETVTPPPLPDGARPCGYSVNGGDAIVMTSRGMTMQRLADYLNGQAGRVVIDGTALEGDYAFTLTYDLPRTTTTDTPTVFTALQEQLGLKLEPARAAVETLVVDHIERPTEN